MKNSKNNYFLYTKNLFISLLFILPFLLIYESLYYIVYSANDIKSRNLAEVVIRNIFEIFSPYNFIVEIIVILIIFIFLLNKNKKRNINFQIKPLFMFMIIFEGILYGLLLLLLFSNFNLFSLKNAIYNPNLLETIYLSIGAGIWEEVLFRGILLSFCIYLYSFISKSKTYLNFIFPVIFTSILFSWIHYVGNSGDIFNYTTFLIRFLAGMYLGVLFIKRGLGVVCMCHISYNVILAILKIYN